MPSSTHQHSAQLPFEEATGASGTKRVVRNGAPTNDLVLSAYAAANEEVFPKILDLYIAPGSVVADVTYGNGVFWNKVEPGRYEVLPTDLTTGTDCRDLPYEDGSIDCVVFDPPYMHSPGEPLIPVIGHTSVTTRTTALATGQRASTTKRSWNYTSMVGEKPTGCCETVG